MLSRDHYVPILKWKTGEQRAIKELEPAIKAKIRPLFLIPPIPWDFENDNYKCTIDKHLEGFGQKLHNIWQSVQPVMIDAEQIDNELMGNGSHPIEYVVNEAENYGVAVIPVTGFDKSNAYNDAVKTINKKYKRGIAIRIKQPDFQTIGTSLPQLMQHIGVNRKNTDLIFDCEEITQRTFGSTKDAIIAALARISNLSDFRTIIVSATAFPKTLAGMPNYTIKKFPRSEWFLWNSLISTPGISQNIIYSDYTIDDPYWPDMIDLKLLIKKLIGNVRYTREECWYVVRGEKIFSQIGYRQFYKVCELLVTHPDNILCGQNYSSGDKRIFECAKRRGSTGNLGTWFQAGVNHHITFVVNQLAQHSASLGTP